MALTPDERWRALEERMGCALPDREAALSALTHKSFLNEHPGERADHNERLEFIGDAALQLAVTHRLVERFPEAREGELSHLRASLVSAESFSGVARRLGLGELMLVGRGERRRLDRETGPLALLSDAFEAVVAVVYLCAGLEGVLGVVDRLLAPEFAAVSQASKDFKTRLQQLSQERFRASPRYQLVSETGPDHDKVFEVEVQLLDKGWGRGAGRSKKEAEQAAARETLGMLGAGSPA
ncbi:MAG: ribonuclease [Pseudomonadota bacterium]|jgi:ribonuclease-3